MGRHTLTEAAFRSVADEVKRRGGSVTQQGEEEFKATGKFNPLVDPKEHGVIRESRNRFDEVDGKFVLNIGYAMLAEIRWDTTGSMAENVQLAFEGARRRYRLFKEVPGAPLRRYDMQNINGIFGDAYYHDQVMLRSMAEMAEKIVGQLCLMPPFGSNDTLAESPEYGIFGGAYLTKAAINRIGLKSYDFTTTDDKAHGRIEADIVKRIYGDKVFDLIRKNGYEINPDNMPSLEEVVRALLKRAHSFLIQIRNNPATTTFWRKIYGRERVVVISSTEYLPEVEAAILGLTEGTLDLQNVGDFLRDVAEIPAAAAKSIAEAVSNIPVGAQAALPNFDKVPLEGAVFASKTDAWPEGFDADGNPVAKAPGAKSVKKKGEKVWL